MVYALRFKDFFKQVQAGADSIFIRGGRNIFIRERVAPERQRKFFSRGRTKKKRGAENLVISKG